MKLTGNTIFITGGGSGIGRGLAEALHAAGNKVIISGRRKQKLAEVTDANPGIDAVELDVADPASIAAVAKELTAKYPDLNVLINNAGIAESGAVNSAVNDDALSTVVTTNLLGPIRLTSALIDHLKSQPSATVAHVTSGLAFTPLALGAVYCSTKAALHSYTMSQRYSLKSTSVKVLEIIPPYVQTELGGERQLNDPMAMPLKDFIEETMKVLATDADEVIVDRAKMLRNNAGPNEYPFFNKFNDMMANPGAKPPSDVEV